jgi:outer membrane receptor protein involved in Fe transport
MFVRRRLLIAVACALVAIAPALVAQVTTSNIAGNVTAADGSGLPGVTVEAVHVPTGTHYDTVSGGDGRYTIPNVRVGGPYTITASLEGFKPTTVSNIAASLGNTAEVDLKMVLAAVSEAITVTAAVDPVINPDHTGSTSAVSTEQIQMLPTVNRQIQDFARTNPYFTTSLTGDGTFMFVAGRNNRYNTIQIDGAANNDLFGLSSSGTPGGGSGTQPVSLDAIQEIQLVVSPYDVRQSGFTGGGVNAVTRSGSNDWDGSVFGTKRNPSFVGKGPTNTKVGDFDQTQYGGRIGGPIMKDKVFFFFSGERNKRNDPNGTSADGSTGIVYTGTPSAADVANFLKSKYNYDTGSLGDLVFNTESKLYFGRIDANLAAGHNLTLRHNYIDANNVNAPSSFTRSTSRFYFPNNTYLFPSKTHSTVAQLNSVFGSNMFNEARVSVQKIREHRETPGTIFPTIEIGASGGERNGTIQAGIERFSGANALDQNITEITDDFTYTFGGHNLVLGTHNELFEFSNLFIQDFYGYYHFTTLANLQAGTPDIYRIGFATGSDPSRPTQFKAAQHSLYASDQWHLNNGWTLTFGLRADKPRFNTTPSFNPAVQAALGRSTSQVPSERVTWEPRVGFNWAIPGAGKQQLRGGTGVFQGRTPFVWISNNYGNTGVEQILRVCSAASCLPAFNPDPNTQSRLDGVAGIAQDIALSDPSFRFPRVLRSTLGYDRDLWYGIRGTVEVLYSKTQEDVFYQNVAKTRLAANSPLDNRPTYANINSGIANAYLLTNTGEGEELTETLMLSKTLGNLELSANYAHQKAESVGDWTSSTAGSNWQFGYVNKGDIYADVRSTTQFEIKHRWTVNATYNLQTGPLTHGFGLYYAAQAGQPYSLLMNGDPNRDGSQNNDLLYVPGPGNLILCPTTSNGAPTAAGACRTSAGAVQAPLDVNLFYNFLKSVGLNPTSGSILDRNNIRQPYTRRLDFHYQIGLPQVYGARVIIESDILNVLNIFDKENGVQRFVTNATYFPITYSGQDPTTGKPVYREAAANRLTPGTQFSTANLGSRWQGRLGLRVNF